MRRRRVYATEGSPTVSSTEVHGTTKPTQDEQRTAGADERSPGAGQGQR
jgi:hypothetical protein